MARSNACVAASEALLLSSTLRVCPLTPFRLLSMVPICVAEPPEGVYRTVVPDVEMPPVVRIES